MASGRRPSHDIVRFKFHGLLRMTGRRVLFCGFLLCFMCSLAAGRPFGMQIGQRLLRSISTFVVSFLVAHTGQPKAAIQHPALLFPSSLRPACLVVCSATCVVGGRRQFLFLFMRFLACSPNQTMLGADIVCYEFCSLVAFHLSAWWARLGGPQL